MCKKYEIKIKVKIKNKKEIKKAYTILKKGRKKITTDDILSLPIVWDIKKKII